MGGSSSSSSTSNTTNTNTSGSAAVSGDNTGTIISGVNNSTINTTVTDHGAINAAGEAINNALDAMATVNKDSIDGIVESNKNALDVVSSTNSNLSDLAMQAASNAKETMSFADGLFDKALTKIENTATGGDSGRTKALVTIVLFLTVAGGIVYTMKAYKGK